MLLNCGVGEGSCKSLGLQGDQTSQLKRKSTLNIHWKDWCWIWSSNTLATWCKKSWLIRKDPVARKGWKQEEKGTTEDEMVGWHHRLNGREFEQAPGVGGGQGSLACCSPWGSKESDTTEQLNWLIWISQSSLAFVFTDLDIFGEVQTSYFVEHPFIWVYLRFPRG